MSIFVNPICRCCNYSSVLLIYTAVWYLILGLLLSRAVEQSTGSFLVASRSEPSWLLLLSPVHLSEITSNILLKKMLVLLLLPCEKMVTLTRDKLKQCSLLNPIKPKMHAHLWYLHFTQHVAYTLK